jgi:hypothetical protein
MRAFLTVVIAFACFVLIRMLLGFLPLGKHGGLISTPIALVAAVGIGFYVWRVLEAIRGLFTHVVIGALITGVIGFAAGFFGPMIFKPDANQGPLLGIFITGPVGAILGGIGGFIVWRRKKDRVTGSPGAAGPPSLR